MISVNCKQNDKSTLNWNLDKFFATEKLVLCDQKFVMTLETEEFNLTDGLSSIFLTFKPGIPEDFGVPYKPMWRI